MIIAELLLAIFAGGFAGIISMWVYKRLSPQFFLMDNRDAQRASRSVLRHYDGDLMGLYSLIGKDLYITLLRIKKILIPTMASLLTPAIIFWFLYQMHFGENAQYTYFAALVVSSLWIKVKYKIL